MSFAALIAIGTTIAETIGTVGIATIAASPAIGAATSAAMGKDPGEGALMGLAGGVATAGLGSLVGSVGGTGLTTASEAALNTTKDAAINATKDAAINAAAPTVGDVVTDTAMNQVTNAVAPMSSTGTSIAPIVQTPTSNIGSFGSPAIAETVKDAGVGLIKEGIGTGIDAGYQQVKNNAANTQAKKDMAMADIRGAQQTQAAEEDANKMYGPAGGLGGGRGLGMNEGGGVRLREGQFIIPADVVSALGNGSTKAGASFLDGFFAAG